MFLPRESSPESFEDAVAPTNIGLSALLPTILFNATAVLVVIARLYTRRILLRAVGKEDYLIVIATVVPSSRKPSDVRIDQDDE